MCKSIWDPHSMEIKVSIFLQESCKLDNVITFLFVQMKLVFAEAKLWNQAVSSHTRKKRATPATQTGQGNTVV